MNIEIANLVSTLLILITFNICGMMMWRLMKHGFHMAGEKYYDNPTGELLWTILLGATTIITLLYLAVVTVTTVWSVVS